MKYRVMLNKEVIDRNCLSYSTNQHINNKEVKKESLHWFKELILASKAQSE